MRRLLLQAVLVAVILASLAGTASASGTLTTTAAKATLVHWSLSHGMTEARVERCKREAAQRLRCQMVETGEWSPGLEAHEVWSLYTIARLASGRLFVQWVDFVYLEPSE